MIKFEEAPEEQLQFFQNVDEFCITDETFIAESPKVISRALRAGYKPICALANQKDTKQETIELFTQLDKQSVPIYIGTNNQLKSLTGNELVRGMLCLFEKNYPCKNPSLLKIQGPYVYLESVTDPTDLGAMIRSFAAMGIRGILLDTTCCHPFSRRAGRVSMGTVFQIPWTFVTEPEMQSLSTQDITWVGVEETTDSISLEDTHLWNIHTLILCISGSKLSDNIKRKCRYYVKMPDSIKNLTLSEQTAILSWECCKKIIDKTQENML